MPTENRRIATYLPRHIDERLEAFKSERSIKGDSQALITILSEFFQVSREVTHQGISDTQLQHHIELLRGELLNELESKLFDSQASIERRLQKLEEKVNLSQFEEAKLELISELEKELLNQQEAPGQLNLVPLEEVSISGIQADESPSELNGELQNSTSQTTELKPLSESALAQRLRVTVNALRQARTKDKKVAGSFAKWSRVKDDDDIAWEYDAQTRLFQPVF
jgi:hypothetical protein